MAIARRRTLHSLRPGSAFIGFACATLLFVGTARAAIEVNVTHVGFPGVRPAGDVFRYGCWTPITVDLALIGQPSFDGFVRVAQLDSDGDETFDAVEVHLRAETGGTQRVFLYAPASAPDRGGTFLIEVRTMEGELISVISEGQPKLRAEPAAEQTQPLRHDDALILSLSTGAIGRVVDLADDTPAYARSVAVAHMSPADLPELAIGLEAVDYIVWEEAQPELLSKKQLAAIVEWVRRGGTLLISAARSAGALKLSPELEPILPVELGELVSVDDLPDVRNALLRAPRLEGDAKLLQTDWLDYPFPQPASLVKCLARPGARVVAREVDPPCDVITRRGEGNGEIIFSAIALRDLFSAPCDSDPFFSTLFYFIVLQPNELRGHPEALFDHVAAAVGFSSSGTVYLLIAALFSMVYVAGATFGLWAYLGTRGWRRHSWTAFAVAGGLASALSVMAVGAVRGIGDRLHQLSVIDVESGQREGFGTALFGLKTAVDKSVDVWLPDNWKSAREPIDTSCWLRPIPASGDSTSEIRTRFADPAEYRLQPSTGVVEGVRIRATLKRFEGHWAGPMDGTVSGKIHVADREILDGSFVTNDLSVDLRDCVLIIPRLDPDHPNVRGPAAMYAVQLGTLKGKGQRVDLIGLPALAKDPQDVFPLKELQTQWGREFLRLIPGMRPEFSLGQERNALLLASTIGDFEPTEESSSMRGMFGLRTWSRDRLRGLDLRSHLLAGKPQTNDAPAVTGQAVLIGFADDPGPVRLFTRTRGIEEFGVLEPEAGSSWTMYRVRLPLIRAAGGSSS